MMPEYFEFYNPVKIMCGEAALENIPYELTRLGAHKIFVLISRTMLNDGILERIGGVGKALIERFFLCGGQETCTKGACCRM